MANRSRALFALWGLFLWGGLARADHRDEDVLEDLRLKPAEKSPHAWRLDLETADRVSATQELVGRLVVEGDVVDVEVTCPPLFAGEGLGVRFKPLIRRRTFGTSP